LLQAFVSQACIVRGFFFSMHMGSRIFMGYGSRQEMSGSEIQPGSARNIRQLRFSTLRATCGVFVVMLVASGLMGCKKAATQPSRAEFGIASWYGQQFQGRLTASGETFDMEKMTAAHRTLPFGTKVRVQNLVNQKSVEVRINDRGPFVKDRIIDLSHAAAQAIGMQGIANIRLEVLSIPPTRGADMFAVQIGVFTGRSEAEPLLEDMQRQYGTARVIFREGDKTWRVLVGLEPTIEQARSLLRQLDGESGSAFVVRVDAEE